MSGNLRNSREKTAKNVVLASNNVHHAPCAATRNWGHSWGYIRKIESGCPPPQKFYVNQAKISLFCSKNRRQFESRYKHH